MEFQYISCYCLSLIWIQIIQAMQNFNTSHVTVYPNRYHTDTVTFHISIHLMLLFIMKPIRLLRSSSNFNTSHVTVYLISDIKPFKSTIISIHLMLLFILSLMMLRSFLSHFNTSHVTVYRNILSVRCHSIIFQYISCYCLSSSKFPVITPIVISIHLMLLFIVLPSGL